MMLARTKLEAFKKWLDNKGIAWRDGKGVTQAMQVCTEGDGWGILYNVADTPYHLKVGINVSELVAEFLAFQTQYTDLVTAAHNFTADFNNETGRAKRYYDDFVTGLTSCGEYR